MSQVFKDIEAIVFDAYGTLFDTQSIVDVLEADMPGRGKFISQLWRLKQLEYSWLYAAGDRYVSFETVTRDALRYCLGVSGIPDDVRQIDKWMGAYNRLSLYPDVTLTLRQLSGFRLALFSNGSPSMLDTLTGHAGLGDAFEKLISVDAVRAFKPSPKAYLHACSSLQLAPEKVLLVSSNGFDVQGAAHFGLKTAHINRTMGNHIKTWRRSEEVDASTMYLALRSFVEKMEHQPDLSMDSLRDLTMERLDRVS